MPWNTFKSTASSLNQKRALFAQNISLFTAVITASRWRCLLCPRTLNQLSPLSPYKADAGWKKRQWTSDLSFRLRRKLCSSGATRVHHPLCLSSPQCLTLPSHKPPLKTSCSPFYGCQMVGRPPCLWTCLSSLVKPVDLSNIKTAIYEKAWNKTHKHPASETIKCHLISQRALLQDESGTAETAVEVYPCTGVGVEVQM